MSSKVNEIDLKLDSPNGRVEVQWQSKNGKFDIRILVPAGSTAIAELPDGSSHALTSGENKLSCAL